MRRNVPEAQRLPWLAARLFALLVPASERKEILSELTVEYAERRSVGGVSARIWVWRQVLGSVPSLVFRGAWRGWSGFEAGSDRLRPGGGVIEDWAQDVRFSLRRLRRRPAYTALTVLTLSLGVAGAAAVYGIAQRVLLDPLPVPGEEEVAVFWMEGAWSQAEFGYLRPEVTGFQSLAAFRRVDVTFAPDDGPTRLVQAATGTAELFEVLGVRPALGAGFQPGDDVPGAGPVVVLSQSMWRELGGSASIIGEAVELAGVTYTVVGVMPPGFWFPDPTTRAWLALQVNPENRVGNYGLIGRVAPGASLGVMSPHLDRIATVLREQFDYPEGWDPTRNPELIPLRDYVVGASRPALLAMLGAMAVILLIACVNAAALMLGQVDSRGTELAVRTALGAGRRRLVRQLVVESGVVGVLAGLAGAALAALSFGLLTEALPLGVLAETAVVDWTLFWAAMGLAIAAATAVALVPGLAISRGDLQARLTRSRTAGISGRGGRLERSMVVVQVGLVLVLAAGAALLIRSVANLRAIDPGVRTAGVAVIDMVMPVTTTAEERRQVVREAVAAVEALPGVSSVGATQRLPLRGSSDNWGIAVESRPDLDVTTTAFRVVTPEYFETMGITLVEGRGLLDTDRLLSEEGTVVINRALADRYFPDTDPIGQRIGFMSDRWDRIVGVVEDVAESTLTAGAEPARYMLYEHVPWLLPGQTLVIGLNDRRDAAAVLEPARRAIQSALPGVAIQELTTLERVFERSIGPARQVMALLSLLSVLALVLGVVGVYGVVSHFVTRRRRDWGIRMALGLSPTGVVRRIVGEGGALVAAGIVLGLAAFLALARLLGSFLHEVGPADPVALTGAAGVLLVAGLLAAFLPAQRASRIDPSKVLREE